MDGRELSWRERGRLWMRLGIRLVLTVLVLAALYLVGPPLLSLFMPFVLAFILALVLNPVIKWIQKRMGISRKLLALLLIVLLFAGVGGLLFAFVYNIISEIISLGNNYQSILTACQNAIGAVSGAFTNFMDLLPDEILEAANQMTQQLMQWMQDTVPVILSTMGARATNLAMGVPSFAVAAVVFVMGSYFITADYPHIRFLLAKGFTGAAGKFLGHVRDTAMSAFGGYVKAQLILSIGVFFILLIGFTLIGQSYGLLLAFLLSVLDFIPIIGAGTAMIPWAVVDLFVGDYRHAIELMVIWGIIALFRRLAEAKVVGDQTGLPPVMSLISIYVGMRLGGVWGMILGPVLCLVVINICKGGVFDSTLADLHLAGRDLGAFLKCGPGPDENSKNM